MNTFDTDTRQTAQKGREVIDGCKDEHSAQI